METKEVSSSHKSPVGSSCGCARASALPHWHHCMRMCTHTHTHTGSTPEIKYIQMKMKEVLPFDGVANIQQGFLIIKLKLKGKGFATNYWHFLLISVNCSWFWAPVSPNKAYVTICILKFQEILLHWGYFLGESCWADPLHLKEIFKGKNQTQSKIGRFLWMMKWDGKIHFTI